MMATAADYVVAEVEELVELGQLPPDEIHTPGIFVDAILQRSRYEKRIERRTTRLESSKARQGRQRGNVVALTEEQKRERIARRIALELRDGYYVNLGIGMPTLVANYMFPRHGRDSAIGERHTNLGFGPYPLESEIDPDLINAGKETVTELPGTCYFSSADSFGMIRGGHVDPTCSARCRSMKRKRSRTGRSGKMLKGMGGAMDLVARQARVHRHGARHA